MAMDFLPGIVVHFFVKTFMIESRKKHDSIIFLSFASSIIYSNRYLMPMTINPRNVFETVVPGVEVSQRRLQSIAFHLRVNVDIEKSSRDELIFGIGSELIKKYFHPAGCLGPSSPSGVILPGKLSEELLKLATQHHVSESDFGFLEGFSKKFIYAKLRGEGIVDGSDRGCVLQSAQSIRVVIGYLCDISKYTADLIACSLMELDDQIKVMRIAWDKYISWFSRGKKFEKLKAAAFYSGKQINKVTEKKFSIVLGKAQPVVLMPVIRDYDDLEIFFYSLAFSPSEKILAFERIRDLYNTRSSREKNRKNKRKSCSFVLDEEAEDFIKKLAEEHRMKGSALLNTIFQEGNKNGLISLLKNHPKNG